MFIDAFSRAFPDEGCLGDHRALRAMFEERDYERRLRAQIMEPGFDGRIQPGGFTNDMRGYLDRFDILVH